VPASWQPVLLACTRKHMCQAPWHSHISHQSFDLWSFACVPVNHRACVRPSAPVGARHISGGRRQSKGLNQLPSKPIGRHVAWPHGGHSGSHSAMRPVYMPCRSPCCGSIVWVILSAPRPCGRRLQMCTSGTGIVWVGPPGFTGLYQRWPLYLRLLNSSTHNQLRRARSPPSVIAAKRCQQCSGGSETHESQPQRGARSCHALRDAPNADILGRKPNSIKIINC
jgi:hypothetical protein